MRAVKAAIDASGALTARNVDVFPQGSYYNRTNVRAESDVDICVRCRDPFFFEVPSGTTLSNFGYGLVPENSFDLYRAQVGTALRARFGLAAVRTGTKAFEIHENTYRIAADVVAVLEYRSFRVGAPPVLGAAFKCQGQTIVNYPEQHYANGIAKNDATGRRFKGVARILKRMRYEMMNARVASAEAAASFAIESMVWNVPDPNFGGVAIRDDVSAAIRHLYHAMENDQSASTLREINGIKPLFGAGQPWTREQLRAFLYDAWNFAGFSHD